jgi:hypothetical protein
VVVELCGAGGCQLVRSEGRCVGCGGAP